MFALNLSLFAASILVLIFCTLKQVKRNLQMLLAIFLGGFLGIILKSYSSAEVLKSITNFYDFFAIGYIKFLQMLIFPVASVAILKAFLHIADSNSSTKPLILIIIVLILTTSIAAFVGFISAYFIDFNLNDFKNIISNEALTQNIQSKEDALNRPFHLLLTSFISNNIFADLTGRSSSSLGSIVVFFTLVGFAYLSLHKNEAEYARYFKITVNLTYKIFMFLVQIALKITPFGILALFAKLIASTEVSSLIKLSNFIIVSYIAMFAMFIFHLILISISGISLKEYLKKTFTVLSFGFFAKSSSAAIPLNIQAQKNLGIREDFASVSASFGTVLGQNGCAGIYPAMLITLVAKTMGINILDFNFILPVIFIVTINSFGIAGVGGGALFAAIAGLTAFNMPLTIVILLAGIEPLIDMGRTALNINGSITSSIVSSKITNSIKSDT